MLICKEVWIQNGFSPLKKNVIKKKKNPMAAAQVTAEV